MHSVMVKWAAPRVARLGAADPAESINQCGISLLRTLIENTREVFQRSPVLSVFIRLQSVLVLSLLLLLPGSACLPACSFITPSFLLNSGGRRRRETARHVRRVSSEQGTDLVRERVRVWG